MDKKNILELLEKNKLNNYINSRAVVKTDCEDRLLNALYVLLLDREELMYIKELKAATLKEEKVEKIKLIEPQLLQLIAKREQVRLNS